MDSQREWDRFLPFVIWAYNSSPHCSTRSSPYQVLHSFPPRQPLDLCLPAVRDSSSGKELLQHVSSGFRLIHRRLKRAQQVRNRHYNKKARYRPIRVGQLVMLNTKVLRPGQFKALRRKWTGPYRVLKQLSPVTYAISRQSSRGKPMVVHHDRLKLFVQGQQLERSNQRRAGRARRQTMNQDVDDDPRDVWEPLREPTPGPRRSERIRRQTVFYPN